MYLSSLLRFFRDLWNKVDLPVTPVTIHTGGGFQPVTLVVTGGHGSHQF
jgi:hypothetical protein